MAIFHLDISTVRRSRGRSIVQLVAYITGTKLTDHRTGKTHRRSSKDDHILVGGFGPSLDPEALWNRAEEAERRKDAVVGRHMIVALPHDVSHRERRLLLHGMAERIHQDTQAPVVYAMHEDCDATRKPQNSHGHIVWAARRWDNVGQRFSAKTRELDVPRTGGKIFEAWREDWESRVNQVLPKGVTPISRLSHVRAGRDRKPRKHLGDRACEIERRGGRSNAGDYNRLLDQLDVVQSQREELTRAIALIEHDGESMASMQKDLSIANTAIASMPKGPRNQREVRTKRPTPDARDVMVNSALVPNPLSIDLAQAARAVQSSHHPEAPDI